MLIQLFFQYVNDVINFTELLINFNLDGILEIFLTLNENEKSILSKSLKVIITELDENKKKTLLVLIPDNAKIKIGV